MTSLFKRIEVPRTNVAHQNPIHYNGGLGVNEFFAPDPDSKYFGRQICPPDNKWSDGTPSFMAPVSHFHLLQTETFHVESGKGLWYLRGKTIQLDAGDDITVPRCVPHRFESLPGHPEPLSILYRYDGQRFEMEERFFRNALTYLDDCRKHTISPSLLQLCLFLADCWMPGDFIPIPGGPRLDYLRCAVNTIFTWVMAFIARFICGYRRSYEEYYDPVWSRKRVSDKERKDR